jgi:hypothetical protein
MDFALIGIFAPCNISLSSFTNFVFAPSIFLPPAGDQTFGYSAVIMPHPLSEVERARCRMRGFYENEENKHMMLKEKNERATR